MLVLGVTGSIGAGKTTFSRLLATYGGVVLDADKIVHQLLHDNKEAIASIVKSFGKQVLHDNGSVDRKKLGSLVFGNDKKLKKLETILHPMIQFEREREIKQNKDGAFFILDVPLLFETETHKRCDINVLLMVAYATRKQRVMARPGMNEERFEQVDRHQMDDRQKALKADIVLDTSANLATLNAAAQIIAKNVTNIPRNQKHEALAVIVKALHGNMAFVGQ